MGLGDFFDRVKDVVEMKDNFVNDIAEIGDNFVNDVRTDWEELKKEGRETMRNIGRDCADKINPEASDALEGIFILEDKARENINNLYNTINNPTYGRKNVVTDDDLHIGDHIYTKFGITHHGIYIGNGEVSHYSLDEYGDICIHIVTFNRFSDGQAVFRMSKSESPTKYTGNEIVRRADNRLYEDSYNLLFNNCEHFARWCRFGD